MTNIFDVTYNELVCDVLNNGISKIDRTKVGTLSKFGCNMRFDISMYFPLLTTKKIFFKGVVEELLWMLRGDTNANNLSQQNVKIWDANGSRDFLDNLGLGYEEGHLGPVYGHQWRHYNAKYINADVDYTSQGIDQISDLIKNIKNDPNSRRHILNAWNPCQVKEMVLPPCHIMCQFYCNESDKSISCQMYQRSGDIGLGIPFNIASYSLLTYIIGHYCGYKPKEFIHVIGDAHIYNNHVDALEHQLTQESNEPPTLELINMPDDFSKLNIENFKLNNYKFNKTIEMKMAL